MEVGPVVKRAGIVVALLQSPRVGRKTLSEDAYRIIARRFTNYEICEGDLHKMQAFVSKELAKSKTGIIEGNGFCVNLRGENVTPFLVEFTEKMFDVDVKQYLEGDSGVFGLFGIKE